MAASWLERQARERVEDVADVLAHHLLQALELSRAAGRSDDAPELESSAVRFLALSGERALNLDAVSAGVSLRRGLELAPQGHPARARILVLLARSEEMSGNLREAVRLFDEAVAARSPSVILGGSGTCARLWRWRSRTRRPARRTSRTST